MYPFALDQPPGHNFYKEPRIKLFEKIKKSVLSHITFSSEDDDHKQVGFNREAMSFTCQLIIIKRMNLNMIRLKIETEDLILSITKNFETLIKQTQRKAEETLDLKLTKTKETVPFETPNVNQRILDSWVNEFRSMQFFFKNITEENYNIELYTDNFEESSFQQLKDELQEIVNLIDTTPEDLKDDILGPRVIQAYKNIRYGKSSTAGYIMLLMGCAKSLFRALESYLRIVVGLNEDDIHMNLTHYTSHFITYERPPRKSSIKDISEIVYIKSDRPGNLQLEYDDISLKTKLVLKQFRRTFVTIGTLRFDKYVFSMSF